LTTTSIGSATQAARTALAAILSLAAFVFIFGMPWNDLGLWRQTEVPAAMIHFASVFVAFLIGFLVFKKDEETIGLLRHPAVLAIAGLALFTAAMAPFTDSTWRSIHGTLKHGIGALWHLELALLVVSAALVLRSKAAIVLETALVVSTAGVIALYALPDSLGLGRPMSFSEWVGMLAAAVSFVIVSRGRTLLSLRTFIAVAILASGIYVSDNRTVMLSVVACAILLAAFRLPVISNWFASPRFRAGFVIASGLAGIAVMAAIAPVMERSVAGMAIPPGTEMVLSDNPIDHHALQDGIIGTLWSRSHMVLMVLGDIVEHPGKLLTGNGWGSFGTVYEYHAREVPGRGFPTSISTASYTYWDAQKMSDFHSHDLPVEALLSGGIVAFALWFAAIGSVAATSRTGLLAATGIMVGALFWFPVNHMTVALATLLACGVTPVSVSGRAVRIASLTVAIPVSLLCAVFMVAGAQLFTLSVVEHTERYFRPIEADKNPQTCSSIATVMLPEDEVNTSLYEVLSQRILRAENRPKEVYDHTTNLMTLSCTLRRYYQNGDNIKALVMSLEKRAMLVAIGPASYGPMVDDIVNWGKDVDRLLEMAPQRTEHVIPYLAALSQRSQNKDRVLAEFDRLIAKLPPVDPITVYVTAMRASQVGDDAAYRDLLKKAVKLGYANIFPITEKQAKELGLR
jgi:hypothetical protein